MKVEENRFIKRSTHLFAASLLFAAFVLIFYPQMAQAGRVVDFQIRLDGKLALLAHKLDQGEAPDVVWDYLKTVQFALPPNRHFGAKGGYAEGFEVKPDADNPLHATLTGNLQLYCRYGGMVDLTTLKLVRSKPDVETWQIAPEEIERTFKIRNLNTEVKPLK